MTAAAVVATVVFAQVILSALAPCVIGLDIAIRFGESVVALAFCFIGALIGTWGGFGLYESVRVIRGKPRALFDFQLCLAVSAYLGGMSATVTLALAAHAAATMSWPALLAAAGTRQSAGLLLLWLNAIALAVALALLRKQGQPYADWWRQQHASESTASAQ